MILTWAETEAVLLDKIVVASASIVVEDLLTCFERLFTRVVLNEVGLLIGLPPSCVVDIAQSGRVPNCLHFGLAKRLAIVQLLNDSAFFVQFVFVFEDLLIVPLLLPVTADVANTPQLLAEWLTIQLKVALLIAQAAVLLPA